MIAPAATKYALTPDLTDELKRAYLGDKAQLTAALTRLVMRTGWPRAAIQRQAVRLGLTRHVRRAWTPAETAYLEENLGVVSLSGMARHLHRSRAAVSSKGEKMGLSRRAQQGYNITDLTRVFGVAATTVRRWMDRGLFGPVKDWSGQRVTEEAVIAFIRQHHAEYDLRRVDQVWYKAMVFAGAVYGHGFGLQNRLQDEDASGDPRRS